MASGELHFEFDLSEFTSTVTDSGDLSQARAAVLAGTSGGLSCVIDDTTAIYGENTISSATGRFRIRIYLDPNSSDLRRHAQGLRSLCRPRPA